MTEPFDGEGRAPTEISTVSATIQARRPLYGAPYRRSPILARSTRPTKTAARSGGSSPKSSTGCCELRLSRGRLHEQSAGAISLDGEIIALPTWAGMAPWALLDITRAASRRARRSRTG
jgi:hypothetical protein